MKVTFIIVIFALNGGPLDLSTAAEVYLEHNKYTQGKKGVERQKAAGTELWKFMTGFKPI